MINGKKYYYLGTYSKPPSIAHVQKTGASVYERRLHKSFPIFTTSYTGKKVKGYEVYYRDVKDPKKYKIAQKARKLGIAPNRVLRGYGVKDKPELNIKVFGVKL